jgi:hypothetical protein
MRRYHATLGGCLTLSLGESNNASFAQVGVDIDSLGSLAVSVSGPKQMLQTPYHSTCQMTWFHRPLQPFVSPGAGMIFFCGTFVCMQHCIPPTVTIMRSLS